MYVCTSFVQVQISDIKSTMSLISCPSFHIGLGSNLGESFLPLGELKTSVQYTKTVSFIYLCVRTLVLMFAPTNNFLVRTNS